MRWLSNLWASAGTAGQIALAVAVVAVILGLVWLGVQAGDLAGWLAGN